MLSALGNVDQPPLMTPEAQTPSMFRQGLANFKENMNSPRGQIMQALMAQQMRKMGQMFAPGQMTHQPSALDEYGQYR